MAEIDDITDSATIEAELRRLKEQQDGPQLAPEGTPDVVPGESEPKEEPKVIVEPEAEVKPEEPKVEAKPEPDEKQKIREGTLQRLLREKSKRLEEVERQLAEVQPKVEQVVEKPKEPTYEDDPAEYLKRQLETERQERIALQQSIAQRDAQIEAQRREDQFLREHPDYFKARDILIKSEVEEWEVSGLAEQHQNNIRQMAEAGRRGNAQYAGVAQKLEEVSRQDAIQEAAEKNNRTAEEEALYAIARDTYLLNRAQGMTPDNLYKLAQRRGYKAELTPVPAPAPPAPSGNGDAARERVLQAQRLKEASTSLSEVEGTSATGPKIVRNKNEIPSLNDDELDYLIKSGKYREL